MGCLLIKRWWEIEIKYIISNNEKKKMKIIREGLVGCVTREGGVFVCVCEFVWW
jgi:hypothetical protein